MGDDCGPNEGIRHDGTSRDSYTERELREAEDSEDAGLRRLGIDPDGNPADIIHAVRKQYKELMERKRKRKEE
jgi:hypothetical protein